MSATDPIPGCWFETEPRLIVGGDYQGKRVGDNMLLVSWRLRDQCLEASQPERRDGHENN